MKWMPRLRHAGNRLKLNRSSKCLPWRRASHSLTRRWIIHRQVNQQIKCTNQQQLMITTEVSSPKLYNPICSCPRATTCPATHLSPSSTANCCTRRTTTPTLPHPGSLTSMFYRICRHSNRPWSNHPWRSKKEVGWISQHFSSQRRCWCWLPITKLVRRQPSTILSL